ncbi:MAG: glutathione S-transferase [Hyphococcus sp.]|nr:MAG: glutathione S-transferase [Marinicaulis sp.]
MSGLELIIANKKYSSWSMRPWLVLKTFEIEFMETLSEFDIPNNSAHFIEFSPTKKVPVLKHEDFTVWDSLAIVEYLAELFPEKNLWPEDREQRAHARAISCEMHSGFLALRDECPMNMAREVSPLALSPEGKRDLARVESIWATCLDQSGGPFLFGRFTIADAMFAPVINRIEKYRLSSSATVEQYTTAIKTLPAWQEWEDAGKAEPWICENVEV